MGKKILLVDDAAVIRLILRNLLSDAGYEIAGEASNGAEAIRQYKQLKPDLVMMDITMPEMSGLSALAGIREIDPNAKVVMCSAMGQKGLVIDAMDAGALNFITKPFEKEKVLEVVSKIIG